MNLRKTTFNVEVEQAQQVGSKHYTELEVQPMDIGHIFDNNMCVCKLAKYACRDKDDHLGDLQKCEDVITLTKNKYPVKFDLDTNRINTLVNYCNQFDHSNTRLLILLCFVQGDYNAAYTNLQILIDRVTQDLNEGKL